MTKDTEQGPQTIAVESNALEGIVFYEANYDTLHFKGLNLENKKEIWGEKPPKCRFCHQSKPAVTFSKDAHLVPAFVGNKTLFSRYECDDCNERFSQFEDDLAKMTMGDRAISQVPKRKGFTPLKPQGKKSSFVRDGAGVVIKQYTDEGVFTLDRENSQMVITYDTQPFRPLGVYKALAKIAYGLLPEEDLPNFEELRLWLIEKDVATRKVYADKGHWCFHTFVPGPSPFPRPIIALLRRKADVAAPYLMFFLAFGNWTYQIFVPCPKMDAQLADKPFNVVVYPHLHMLQPWLLPGLIQAKQLFLDEPERKSENRVLRLHFDAIVPTKPPETDGSQTV